MEEILRLQEEVNPSIDSDLPHSKARNTVQPTASQEREAKAETEPHAQAEAMRRKRMLPRPPGKNLDFPQLNNWLESLSDDMWSHVSIYGYRTWPAIIRKLANPDADKYIEKICKEHITGPGGLRGYMIRMHGGGKYKFLVNDLDQQSPKGSVNIIDAKLDIPVDEAMPILNLVELDRTNDKNLGYINMLISKGLLDSKGAPVQPQGSGQDTASVVGQVTSLSERFMDRYMKLSQDQQATINKLLAGDSANRDTSKDAIKDILIEKLKQEDPNKGVSMIAMVIEAMQKMLAANRPPEDKSMGLWDRILQIQAEGHKTVTEMMGKMMELSNSNRDRGDNEDKWLERMAKYKEIFGNSNNSEGGAAGKKHIAEIIVDGIERIGLPTLGLVSQLIQLKTGAKPIIPVNREQAEEMVAGMGGQAQAQRMPDFRDRSDRTAEPRKVVTIAAAPNNNPTINSASPEEVAKAEELAKNPVIQVLASYGQLLANFIKSGKSGAEIGELVAASAAGYGVDIFAILKSQGRDKIIQAMKMIPEFWNQTGGVMGEEHMVTLVDDFLRFEEILAEEEGEEGIS